MMAEEGYSVFISNEGKRKLSYGQLSPPDHPEMKTLKKWLRKYHKKYGTLSACTYDLTIMNSVLDYADGSFSQYIKGGRIYAQINLQEPLNEMVFFHELMHAFISVRTGAYLFHQFSDFSSLDVSVNTRLAFRALFKILEEWFVELFILREIFQIRDDEKRLKKFLGKTLEEYIDTIYSEDEDLQGCDFTNLSTFFHSWRSGQYSDLIRLCRYSVLKEYSRRGCVPKDLVQAPIDGVAKHLHDLLLRYSDLDPFRDHDLYLSKNGDRYYKTLYAEFVNVIVKAQTGSNEPAVIIQRKDQVNVDLIFQPVLQEAVAEFDKDSNFVEHLRTPMIEIIEKMARETYQHTGEKIISKIVCWAHVDQGLFDEGQYFLGHYLIPIFEEEFPQIAAKYNLTIEHADVEIWVDE